MKVIILLVSALSFISAAKSDHELLLDNDDDRSNYNFDDTIFKGVYVAPLDPFSPTNNIRLHLHYSVNVHHLERDGPLFLFLHFEDNTGNPHLHTDGLAYDYVRMLSGGIIKASFRYLGENTFRNSTEQEELNYLTLDHILADIPHLVNKVRADLNLTRSRVVAFGSRIGGALAILARKKFPHIIDGAWSSSGLFRSVMAETDYYNDIAKQVHTFGGAECSERLSKAFQQVKEIVDAKNETELRKIFKITGPLNLDDAQDVQYFYFALFSHLPYFVHTEGIENSRGAIKNFCEDMNEREDALESYLFWYRDQWGDATPNFSYQKMLKIFQSNPKWRAYKFFYCTQFGSKRLVTTANNFENIYPHVITEQYYDQFCSDLFGAKYNRTLLERASENFNLQHGGESQYVSKAIFSEGNMNPYRGSGVTHYNNETSEFVFTNFFAADADMDDEDEDDALELKKAKEKIATALFGYAYDDE